MKIRLHTALAAITAALAVLLPTARAADAAAFKTYNATVKFELSGALGTRYGTQMLVGSSVHSSTQDSVPFGGPNGAIVYVQYGVDLTLKTSLESKNIIVELDYENVIPMGNKNAEKAPPVRALKFHARVSLPAEGGTVTVEDKDIKILRRENLGDGALKLAITVDRRGS